MSRLRERKGIYKYVEIEIIMRKEKYEKFFTGIVVVFVLMTSVFPFDAAAKIKIKGKVKYGTGSASGTSWYDPAWSYRKKIVINGKKVDSSLSNFPVLVNVIDNDLRGSASSGFVQKTGGLDILFTSSNGTTKINHEIELLTESTGNLIAWVQTPTVTPVTDTILYVYFGNINSTDQQNITGVWDSNYIGVWHMDEQTGTALADSTVNALNAEKINGTAAVTNGPIGGAQDFDGANDYASVSSSGLFPTRDFTYSTWVNLDSTNSEVLYRIHNNVAPAGNSELQLFVRTSGQFTGEMVSDLNGSAAVVGKKKYVPKNKNTYIVWARSGSTNTFYLDGVSINTGTSGGALGFDVCDLVFGVSSGASCTAPSTSNPTNGRMDEFRVSSISRSADWILTEYRNQSSPSTFMVLGGRETYRRTSAGSRAR